MHVVVMAGGAGTRFWPLSRRHRPKQLLSLFGGRPMVAETVHRLDGLIAPEQVLVVTGETLVDPIAEALPEVPRANLLAEPFGRNTAPCIALAAVAVRDRVGPDEVLVVLPADHFIRDAAAFRATIAHAAELAAEGGIVTLGVEPTHPETGYGYIRRGELVDDVADVEAFVEKPDRAKALEYLAEGNYLWNAGVFCFRADTILAEIERQMPALAAQLDPLAAALRDDDGAALAQVYEAMPSQSIDYGVMEGAEQVRVVPARFGWSDVGHWDALPSVSDVDDTGNVVEGDIVAIDCRDSVLISQTDRVVAAVGVDRIVVVDTDDALLVAPRERVQEVRAVVDALKARGGTLT